MVIVNGFVQINEKAHGGLDENGNPVRQPETWGERIPCRISAVKQNYLANANGNPFIDASYTILLDKPQPFEAEQLKLTQQGRDLGVFSVQKIFCLEGVGAIEITV